jgi:hypothetical protein
MKMQDIRAKAKSLGMNIKVGTPKADAIRSIQRAEGNFDCFGTPENGYCDQEECLFREDCMPKKKKR